MISTVIGAVLFVFVILFSLLRFTSIMSHIMGWFLESVIRKKPDQGSSEENVPVQLDKDKLTSGSSKTKQKNKKAEEPVFSTNLKIPIEDVIKDSISEEKPVSPKKKGKSRTSTLPQENKKSSQDKKIQSEDSVGYSFFKAESTQVKSEQKSSDKKTSKPKDSVTLDNKPIESGVPNDDIGFSFLPVKEKGKSSKKSSPETKDTVRKIEDVPKPPVLDHHKKKLTQQSFTEKPVVLPKKTICTIEKPQKKPVVYSSEEKSLLQEFKESKKVSSSVSYASVLTNTSPETDSNVEINLKVEEKEEKDNKNIDIDVEIKSDAIAKSTCNIVETEKEFETDAVLVSSKIHTENSSLSNSSSIEIISDDKYIDFQSSFENQSQFEDIEENLNKLVEFVPDLDTAFIVEELSTTEEISAEALSQSTSDSKIQPFSAGGSPETELGYNKIVETEPEVQAIADTTLTKEFKPYFKEEKDLGSKENFNISEDKVNETLLDSKNSSSTKNNDLTTTKLFKESEQLKEEPTPQEIEKVVPHELVEVKQIVPKSSSIDHQQNHSDIKLSDNFLDLQLLERHLEVSDEHNLLTDVTDKVIAQKIPVKKSDYLQEQSASFINEEKCVKKFSYITTEVDENKPLEMATSQMRVLTLNNQEHQECTLYRIEKNWIIQFRLGPSLFGRKVYLYCNYPIESKVKFDREQYQLLDWNLDEGCKNADDTAAYAQIVAKLAGSFHYYFTFEKGHNAARQGSGFFLVDPILKYGNNQDLPLDCIQCQTIISKGLGSFSTWEKKLLVAKETGYNMIHFTPIQELGASNSAYSLSEQLKFNHVFKKENGKMPTFEEIKQLMAKMRKEWKVTSICDIVLNHTANESEWIKVHPEVTYNCVNCPYMRPAYLLDAAFHQFSMDVKKGLYEDKGIPIEIEDEEHLNAIRYHFPTSVLELLKIPELYICDASKLAAEFSSLARITPPVTRNLKTEMEELKIFQDQEYRRLASTVDMKLALRLYNVYRNDTFDEDTRIKKCTEEFKSKLDSLNKSIIEEVNDHLTCALDNVIAGIRYFRVQPDGPRVKEITIKNPLVYRYFTDYGTPTSIKEHEEIMYSNKGKFVMAHNGWVMNSDPLRNFAAPDSNVYIRRELIAWGDSVKLRFGDKPEDCPFLWEHMRKYVEQTAEIFDGVRLDNCHSTPIPVAEYLLDCARRVRPDLYVVAELFTNSDMTDNIFVNRLGITSLIREAMSAWDSHEEGRLVYRYGGSPVGSFYQPRVRPLVPTVAHALFLDLTHDNPSPVEKRSVFDLLPSTALVNMACCASGSNRGYDELVPHHIHVVDEIRQYTEWTDDENLAMGNLRYVTNKTGIIAAKRAINDLHFTLGKEGYNQVYVDQMDPDIVAVTRHRPDTHESYILVAFTAFGHPNEDAANYQRGIKSLRFEGVLNEIVLEATLSHVNTKNGRSKFARWENFVKDSKYINGLSEYCVTIKQHIQAHESDIFEKVDSGTLNVTQLNFKNFKPGSVVIVKSSLPESMKDAIKSVRALIDTFSLTKETELTPIIDKLTLADLNRIIYRCDQEERDEGFGYDTYNIPNFGSLVYAGLQGFISLLANIRPNNDLGHPMCANLRDGNWMIEYVWKRLKLDVGTKELGQWIEENTKCFNNIPRYLVPSYFDVVITGIYVLLLEQSYKLMSKFVNHGSTFVKGLSLGSVQFSAYIKSADLPNLSPNLAPPKPPTRKNDKGETVQACVTLSAGLPHFSVGYMRNWGRDTFIALRGLFILTGRFEEARQHILGYAACLRHGLIPNLLDGGRNPRFNCRDAVWWWLYCIKEYVEEAPKGINILSDKVSRIFPTDDSPAQPAGAVDQVLRDVMQETLKVHFQGLAFRERNGRQIDEHMTDRGFNNQIGVHPETGFVFGGNEWNCGTWMDKMGSSDKAGNRGKPATPRDGSAVELIGLSKAVVTWLWKLSQEKKYPYSGVERTHKSGSVTKWTFKEWSDKIQTSFEKYFWVNDTPVSGEFRPDLINKRGIYKDSYGATQPWTDFQLRCNFPIAMVVAPELFTPQRAWIALKQAEKYLLGPLGMKTLDPEDWTYRGDYDNSNDSNDVTVAHGFNYHQGPEWVWPVGFFLRAKLHFASSNGALHETLASTKLVLSKHFTELQSSVWRGLPELTNSNGLYCRDSSRTQAWSMSCILEVLHDLQKIESNQPVLIN